MSAVNSSHIVLVGAGNIGSQSAPLAARLNGLVRLTIVDHDCYEPANVASQAISGDDVGKSKAIAIAERLRKQAPALRIVPIVGRIEDQPLGLMRGAIVLGALDSREARKDLAQRTWRVRAPLIDAGVNPEAGLVRVSTFMSGDVSAPCYTCDWSNEDYARLGHTHHCDGTAITPAASRAPAHLGALAAALQVAECARLLAGGTPEAGTDVVLDARGRQHFVTGRRRNSACRFDHQPLEPIQSFDRAPHVVTLGDFFESAGGDTMRVEPFSFGTEALCCGTKRLPRPTVNRHPFPNCPECGASMRAAGFSSVDWITRQEFAPQLDQPLSALGLRPLDIIRVRDAHGTERVFEMPQP